MGKPTGFKELPRELPKRRDVKLRLLDWNEVYVPFGDRKQHEGRVWPRFEKPMEHSAVATSMGPAAYPSLYTPPARCDICTPYRDHRPHNLDRAAPKRRRSHLQEN